jgi:hypothetical protein
LTLDLRNTFNDSGFLIPGATLADQIENLVIGIGDMNHGQQRALYINLGGKK